MANFTFKALDLAGVPTNGEIEAEDKRAVSTQLRGKGLIVLDVEEIKPASAGDLLANFRKVKSADLTIATRQLSVMISSGMSLLRALYVLEEQTENDMLKEAWIEVRKDVEAGLAFSEALARHPKIFNDLYVAMVAAGETGGILEQTLVRVSDQLEADDALRRQVTRGDGLPVGDRRLRGDRAVRAGDLPGARVRGRLQGLRRRAAGDHQVHRRRSRDLVRPTAGT